MIKKDPMNYVSLTPYISGTRFGVHLSEKQSLLKFDDLAASGSYTHLFDYNLRKKATNQEKNHKPDHDFYLIDCAQDRFNGLQIVTFPFSIL